MATFFDIYSRGVNSKTSGATLANSVVAVAAPAIFFGIDGRNTGAATKYIMVFNAATVAACTATNLRHIVAVGDGTVAGGGNFGLLSTAAGEYFDTGITVIASTTDFPTVTAAADNLVVINITYVNFDYVQ